MAQAFAQTDAELIESCKADKVLDYVSSTGVVAVLMGKVLSIAHVGDSRVAVGHMVDGSLRGGNMTIDHKPDKPAELRRIEAVRRDGSSGFGHSCCSYPAPPPVFPRCTRTAVRAPQCVALSAARIGRARAMLCKRLPPLPVPARPPPRRPEGR